MPTAHRDLLRDVRSFPSLIKYLRSELDWPITSESFEELTFEYTPEELRIDSANAAKIQEIKRLRPLSVNQPWGIFFVKFEPKRLPVVALRRILSRVVLKKRASANSAEAAAWEMDDLLFVSNYGEGDERRISLAHFSQEDRSTDLPTLRVLGWDNLDTALHLDHVADVFRERLSWPIDEDDIEGWRETWRSAFTLRHKEVITTSKALAVQLAELARAVRDRIESVLSIETEEGPVTKLWTAFKDALVHDLDAGGFADMYAQTIAYGLLAARIEHPERRKTDELAAQLPVTNPFLKELMETFLGEGDRGLGTRIDFDELGVRDVSEMLSEANMEAVVRDFGDLNPQEDPVIHFYELFLREYDPKEKVRRGVFYTPRPVVSFIVRSVDEFLRDEFGLEDGLADTTTWGEMVQRHRNLRVPDGVEAATPFVQILDPATGTGTFLVEVIDVVHRTMTEKWEAAGHRQSTIKQLWNDYVPKYLLPRVHGYELLMAPYAIAHMKIGLKLYETGYRFEVEERARVYLTNSLEPAHDFSDRFDFAIPALAHEAEAVSEIKRGQRFTVVIGNPPYAQHSANPSRDSLGNLNFIGKQIERYKTVDGKPLSERNSKVLQDDYVKFFAFGEWLIGRSKLGVLGLITNNGYLDNPTFRGMRQRLASACSSAVLLDLHGNQRKKESPPPGCLNINVFEIQQGVAISTWTWLPGERLKRFAHGDLWGSREEKYELLLANTIMTIAELSEVTPASPYYLFVPRSAEHTDEWGDAVPLPELFPTNSVGFVSHRDEFAVAWSKAELVARAEQFRSETTSDSELEELYGLHDSSDWTLGHARAIARADRSFEDKLTPCTYRPFDFRFAYLSDYTMDRPRLPFMDVMREPNVALVCTRQATSLDFNHVFASRHPIEFKCGSHNRNSSMMPLYVRPSGEGIFEEELLAANLKPSFFSKLCSLMQMQRTEIGQGDLRCGGSIGPEDVFNYVYAVLHSASYRRRYAEFLKIEFPRVPFIDNLDLFRSLTSLGDELVALHLMKSTRLDDDITMVVGAGDLRVVRVSYSDHTVWLDGSKTIGFRGVPEDVWRFQIGGYQVCKKWLKDRQARGGKRPKPARVLTDADIAHYQKIVVALDETIRLMGEIDKVIEEHGGWPDAFSLASD